MEQQIVADSPSVVVISKYERIKGPFLFIFGGHFLLTLYFALNGQVDVFDMLISLVLALATLAFNYRWDFEHNNQQLRCFKGFRVGGKTLYAFVNQAFSYSDIQSIKMSTIEDSSSRFPSLHIKLYLKDGSLAQRIDANAKPKNFTLYQQQLIKQLSRCDIAIDSQLKNVAMAQQANERPTALDDDTIRAFAGISLLNRAVKRQFVTRTWFMPLTKKRERAALWPSYVGCGLAILVFVATVSPFLPIAILLIGAALSGLFWTRQTHLQYFCPSDNHNLLTIDEGKLDIPGIYFNDRKARVIDKAAISVINITWTWYVSQSSASYSQHETMNSSRTPHVFEISIKARGEEQANIPGMSLNSNQLVRSLHQLGYKATLTRVKRSPLGRLNYVLYAIVAYLLVMCGYGIYTLFTGDYFS